MKIKDTQKYYNISTRKEVKVTYAPRTQKKTQYPYVPELIGTPASNANVLS